MICTFLSSLSFLCFKSELGAKRLLFLRFIASCFPNHTSSLLDESAFANLDLLILADVRFSLALEVSCHFIELIDNSSLLLLLGLLGTADISTNLVFILKHVEVVLFDGGASTASVSATS